MANSDEETLVALREQRDALIVQISSPSGWKEGDKEVNRDGVTKKLREVESLISYYEKKINKTRTLEIKTIGFK